MNKFVKIDPKAWGYVTPRMRPLEIIERLVTEVRSGIDRYRILAIDLEPSGSKAGFKRVCVELAVSEELSDWFFNGNSGIRAQYYDSKKTGEAYSRALLEAIAPLLTNNEQFYAGGVYREPCEKSLLGPYSKFWFPKAVTSIEYEDRLRELPEVIQVDRWVEYWRRKARPRKGLLAPRLERPAILLNGTFVKPETWEVWDQKPTRSVEIHASGWT